MQLPSLDETVTCFHKRKKFRPLQRDGPEFDFDQRSHVIRKFAVHAMDLSLEVQTMLPPRTMTYPDQTFGLFQTAWTTRYSYPHHPKKSTNPNSKTMRKSLANVLWRSTQVEKRLVYISSRLVPGEDFKTSMTRVHTLDLTLRKLLEMQMRSMRLTKDASLL